MDFPTTEADIIALCRQMLNGYFWYGVDFPHVNRTQLYIRRNAYTSAKKAVDATRANLRVAAKETDKKLSELTMVMKSCLRKSEVDVAATPEKLKEIGWAPRANPQPAQLPGQPTNLQITANENQIVTLKWDRPDDNQRVRNYCIERRQQNGEGFSDWTIVHISYSTQATLRNQPLGIQLEYRIRAANNAGTSPASNTIAVVL